MRAVSMLYSGFCIRYSLVMLYLKENDILPLVSMAEAIDTLEQTFRQQAAGKSFGNPRQRLRMPGSTLHFLSGCVPGYFGYKAYASAASGVRFLFFLFDAASSELVAMMEADTLGQLRTGAATGLATRILSNPNAEEATLFGAGWQAESQLAAMGEVRKLRRVWVVNRNPDRCAAFIARMQPRVKAELIAAASAEASVSSSHIITTMTNSREPVLKGAWLQPGQHINAAGGNLLLRRELDDEAVRRADRIVLDSTEQAKIEAGELIGVIETGRRQWQDFVELRDVVSGHGGRRSPTDITLFKSLGLGMEDVALAKLVYERAVAGGIGKQLAL
jgi:ornithine cyclodeaminase/alanine dehydrogenase-like protein (mu-crystallin family)